MFQQAKCAIGKYIKYICTIQLNQEILTVSQKKISSAKP